MGRVFPGQWRRKGGGQYPLPRAHKKPKRKIFKRKTLKKSFKIKFDRGTRRSGGAFGKVKTFFAQALGAGAWF